MKTNPKQRAAMKTQMEEYLLAKTSFHFSTTSTANMIRDLILDLEEYEARASNEARLALCAKINFENFEQTSPPVVANPLYRLAKAQLDEALGGMSVEERFALETKRQEKREKELRGV